MKQIIFFIVTVIVVSSCAPSRYVKPLAKGQKAVTGSFGGPLLKFSGMTIPFPLTSVAGGYGVTDNVTLFSSLHPTSLMFGVVQVELGVVKELVKADSLSWFKPGVSVSHTSNILVDTWEGNFKYWPQIDANLYWTYNRKRSDYFYLGVSNWFELSSKRAHGEPQLNHWIFNPQMGIVLEQPKWNYNLEAKYLAPNHSNQNIVVDYAKPWGKKGGLGIYISVSKKF